MRITTRITLGLALVTSVTVAALAHQLSVVQKLQEINREISLTRLEAARISLNLLHGVNGVQEFVSKSLVLGDADYFTQWADWEEAVEEELRQLHALELTGAEDAERRRVAEGWEAFRQAVAPLPTGGAAGPGAGPGAGAQTAEPSLEAIDRHLERVRGRLGTLMSLTDAAVAAHARSSAEAGDRAQAVSRIAAATAILLGVLICVLLYLSISGPLRRLTGGTRALAAGNFDHRIPARGEDELSELARAFNRMAQRLNELEEMKRDFVSHVSHELKGPLAAIHETILVLLDEIAGPLTEKQAHFLRLSRRSSERLSGMISNLLEVSRLEAGGAEYRPAGHDLEEIARSVLDEHGPVAREREVTLAFTARAGSAELVCDGERIREVVANLVGNAVKFSPTDSEVEVTLDELASLPPGIPRRRLRALEMEAPPFLLLSVRDRGRGIEDAHKEGVFEKFHQVKVEGRRHGQGVGLGLSISRRNVEAHGGAVWVEDAPGGGAIFRTLLPRAPLRWKGEAAMGAAGGSEARRSGDRGSAGRGANGGASEPGAGAPSAGVGVRAVDPPGGSPDGGGAGGEAPPAASSVTAPPGDAGTPAGAGSETALEAGSGAAPGAGSGAAPGAGSGTAPGAGSETASGAGSGAAPGAGSGTAPGTCPGSAPPGDSETPPGTGSGTPPAPPEYTRG